MFDIGFLELMLIGVVALLVVGPERLPRLARTLGLWIGRARRYAATVKSDVEREFREHELHQAMGGSKPEMKDIYEIVEEAQDSVRDVAENLDEDLRDLQRGGRARPATGAPPSSIKADPRPAAQPDPRAPAAEPDPQATAGKPAEPRDE